MKLINKTRKTDLALSGRGFLYRLCCLFSALFYTGITHAADYQYNFGTLINGFRGGPESVEIPYEKGDGKTLTRTIHRFTFTIVTSSTWSTLDNNYAGLHSHNLKLYKMELDIPIVYEYELKRWGNMASIPVAELIPGQYQVEVELFTPTWNGTGTRPSGRYRFLMAIDYLDSSVDPSSAIPPPVPPAPGAEATPGISANQNYIRTRTMYDDSGTSYADRLDYFDQLGRLSQTVMRSYTPAGSDLVTCHEYDPSGRMYRTWKPFAISGKSGAYIGNFALRAQTFHGDMQPFAQTVYQSPVTAGVSAQTSPGIAWRGKAVLDESYSLPPSSSPLQCALYSVSSAGGLVRNGDYPAAKLHISRSRDEDGNTAFRFTDKEGRLLLERQVMDNSILHDTYYVHDDRGRLRFVLPPMINGDISAGNLDLYAYKYSYDALDRCTEKKLPGRQPVRFLYNAADRLVFTQDGNQKTRNEWILYQYDMLGREVATGLYTSVAQPVPDGSYTAQSPLTINYYDNYTFLDLAPVSAWKSILSYSVLSGYGTRYTSAQGKLTGTRVFIPGSATEIITAFYYDDRGNLIQQRSTNHPGGSDVNYFARSFTGKVLKHRHEQAVPGNTTQVETYVYTYDPKAERLTGVTHQLNNNPVVTLSANSYDEQGRIASKKVHGLAAGEQTYTYNIRDWLSRIDGSRFSQNLFYTDGVARPCFNGNISSVTWKAGNETALRGYRFTYDALGRLTEGAYGETDALTPATANFTEAVTSYDKNGNIGALKRYGKTGAGVYGEVDRLTLTHTGNLLKNVTDAITALPYGDGCNFIDGTPGNGAEYSFDANGNLTKDLNKNISNIQYNHLNLPLVVTFSSGGTVTSVYGADGTKLTSTTKEGNVTTKTQYCGNMIYENGTLKMILTQEGYITFSGVTPMYHYFLKDHQGNNRVVINGTGVTEQVNHFYPFGGLFGEGTTDISQPYKYNAKEMVRANGLNWYDYGKRFYDPALALWTTQDPMAEKYYSSTPYAYCGNNPVSNVDMKGDTITTVVTSTENGVTKNTTYYFGQDANGNYGFLDSNGQLYAGGDQFVASLTTALGELRGGARGKALVDYLMGAEKNVQARAIKENQANSADTEGRFIKWNPNSMTGGPDQTGSTTRPPYIGLGHEMAHIEDIWEGGADFSIWNKTSGSVIFKAEKYATHTENQIRSEHGLSLRTHYDKRVRSTGLLHPGTNASLFYKKIVKLGNTFTPTTPYIYLNKYK